MLIRDGTCDKSDRGARQGSTAQCFRLLTCALGANHAHYAKCTVDKGGSEAPRFALSHCNLRWILSNPHRKSPNTNNQHQKSTNIKNQPHSETGLSLGQIKTSPHVQPRTRGNIPPPPPSPSLPPPANRQTAPPAMSWAHKLSAAAPITYGGLCIASALPFAGVSVPWTIFRRSDDSSWVDYYAEKNAWMARLSGDRLTPRQAGYAGAALRVAVGLCCIWGPPVREAALLANAAVVARGTVLAARDGRPMRPQWTMLGAIALCLVLGRL